MAHDHNHDHSHIGFGKILWIALILNFSMFVVELLYGFKSHSSALIADSLDFFGDSFNYALSLFVINMSGRIRSRASQVKAVFMILVGIWVLGHVAWGLIQSTMPKHETMAAIGVLALLVNFFVAITLYRYRSGDSQMQSVWICTRNDVMGNVGVILAGLAVYFTNSRWPDVIVAVALGYLGILSGITIFKLAQKEIKSV